MSNLLSIEVTGTNDDDVSLLSFDDSFAWEDDETDATFVVHVHQQSSPGVTRSFASTEKPNHHPVLSSPIPDKRCRNDLKESDHRPSIPTRKNSNAAGSREFLQCQKAADFTPLRPNRKISCYNADLSFDKRSPTCTNSLMDMMKMKHGVEFQMRSLHSPKNSSSNCFGVSSNTHVNIMQSMSNCTAVRGDCFNDCRSSLLSATTQTMRSPLQNLTKPSKQLPVDSIRGSLVRLLEIMDDDIKDMTPSRPIRMCSIQEFDPTVL